MDTTAIPHKAFAGTGHLPISGAEGVVPHLRIALGLEAEGKALEGFHIYFTGPRLAEASIWPSLCIVSYCSWLILK